MFYQNGCVIYIILTAVFSSVALANDNLSLAVHGKVIELSQDNWTKAKDSTNFAKNYSERKKYRWQQYPRMVTVYLNPLSDDRRIGLKISDSEYLEFFVVNPGFITAQTRVDKGRYWVLCRETFKPKIPLPIDVLRNQPYLSKDINQKLWKRYQIEIDETRLLLNSKF